MIDVIINMLGYTGTDSTVTVIVVATACTLHVCLAYKLFDFILSLITTLIGRGNTIKF